MDPLSTVPAPNVVIGFDHSVTMGIRRDCSGCHAPGSALTRLEVAKGDILATAPLFRDYFTFGGYTYKGCGYAEVTGRIIPTPANPDTSFEALFGNPVGAGGMIPNLTHCTSRENGLPSGGSAWTNCITPTTGCAGDVPEIQNIFGAAGPAIPGLNITQPTVLTSSACDVVGAPVPTYNVQATLIARFAGGAFSWPRWDTSSLSGSDVDNDFCQPVDNILGQIQNELSQCFTNPDAIWDMSFLATAWCDAPQIAGNICTPSRLGNTCVCDQTVTGPSGETCFSAGLINSDCGIPFQFKARQQLAVCELYRPQPGGFGDYYQNQTDNHVNGPLPNFCRENVGMIFTDGYMGDTAGVAAEALNAIPTYMSVSGLSNLFVFRVADPVPSLLPFIAAADDMQDELAGPTGLTTALLATDRPTMQGSFAQVLSRVYKGVYTGSSMTTDEFQTRGYFNVFTVPGYSATMPVTGCSNPPCTGDMYLGWPQRIAAHVINPDGSINPTPRWESDWNSKAGPAGGCSTNLSSIPFDTTMLGPGGTFANGVNRDITIGGGIIDRDGNGTPDPAPGGSGGYRWGSTYGFAATEPVIVDRPREAPGGDPVQATSFSLYQNSNLPTGVRDRPRGIYTMGAGYVVGFHGGNYRANPPAGGYAQKMAFDYDDSVANAGREIMRYMPRWLNDPFADYNYGVHNLVPQPLLNGDLEAREVYAGGSWRTVLAGSGGPKSRGYFTLDVTNPCAPSILGEWTLPGNADRASNQPKIYTVPTAAGPRPALIVTGGLNGSNTMFAYAAVPSSPAGELLYSTGLAGGPVTGYPTTPICVDTQGKGFVTHCYALRSDGYLNRVEVTAGGFVNATDITPVGGSVSPINGARYYTVPAVYFGADGTVNLVFGSGNFEDLTLGDGPNYVFKVIDRGVRKNGVPNQRADVTTSCFPAGGAGPTEGVLALGPNERLISSPVVVGGGVYWTTYTGNSNGCIVGSGQLYGMNYQTCYDTLTPAPTTNRPGANPTGPGIPVSPSVNRRAGTVYTRTSAGPTADQTGEVSTRLRGGLRPIVKPLYWRPIVDNG